ncbi:MAG: hypothetical protein ACRD16_07695 [Thermoanaerobaculia bacterium]
MSGDRISNDESGPATVGPGLSTRGYALRVVAKALVLLVAVDLLQASCHLERKVENVSIYRYLVPPLSRIDILRDYPSRVMWPLEPLLDAHEIGRKKGPDEYRVAVLGDSGSFDLFSPSRDAIPGQIGRLGATVAGRRVVAYNLSYQTPNTLKDLVIERHALRRHPDAVVWFVTLYDLAQDSPPPFRPSVHLLLRTNDDDVCELAAKYGLSTWETRRMRCGSRAWWRDSLWLDGGARYRDLATLLARGVLDALVPGDPSNSYMPRRPWIGSSPLPEAPLFADHGPDEPPMPNPRWATLEAGERMARARGVPLLVVNDPIFIASGPSSGREYNSFYARGIYDRYRIALQSYCGRRGIALLDLWNALAPHEFDNTPQHYLPEGSARIARLVVARLQEMKP